MKIRLFLLFLMFYGGVNSQTEWAPIGAKWYFNRPSSITNDYVVFESKKDSTIQGRVSRIIDVRLNGTKLVGQEYIYQNGDSIFYYNLNYNSFFLLYNFSAKAGDTITVHPGKFKPTKAFFSYDDSITGFKYKILSLDSIQISGQWIKRQKVTLLKNGLWGFSKPDGKDYYILNKIGSLAYFFGVQSGITPEDNLSMCRCYSDSDFEFKNPLWDSECDLISVYVASKILNNNVVYPNPFDDQLNILMTEPIESVEIINVNGLKLQVTHPNKESVIINTTMLNKGCFLLRVITKHHVYSKKLIKNQ